MGGRSPVGAYQIRKPIRSASFSSLSFQIPFFLVLLLAWASVWNGDFGPTYSYQAHARWTGAWDNPNLFGLLMGTGLVLVIGGAAFIDQISVCRRAKGKIWTVGKYLGALLCLLAAVLLGRGLLHSYSRGAWVATVAGFIFLFGVGRGAWGARPGGKRERERQGALGVGNSFSGALPRRRYAGAVWLPATVILASVCVLCFWQFRRTEWHPARRAFSVARTEDFSWRNRVAAWVGDWQMMAEHPWFGPGWNQPEPLYEHYYLSPKLTESAAIQMNDYLLLGATLGVPALFCFGMYVWLTLGREGAGLGARGARTEGQKAEGGNPPSLRYGATRAEKRGTGTVQSLLTSAATRLKDDLLSATCQAGAVVLLVGFWFDGGLFKLPTAATFWILLELGAAQPPNYFTATPRHGATTKIG
jgi:hypothetical protein